MCKFDGSAIFFLRCNNVIVLSFLTIAQQFIVGYTTLVYIFKHTLALYTLQNHLECKTLYITG